MREITLLGSTGSVGKNVLEVARKYPERFRIRTLSANREIELLARQAEEFNPRTIVIGDKAKYEKLRSMVSPDICILAGYDELERTACEDTDIIFMAISGTAALKPLIASISKGKTVALASKEPIVSAGAIIKDILQTTEAHIIPVDSEHSSIMQSLGCKKSGDIRTLYIMGTGGTLKNVKKDKFDSLSIKEVLSHPTWNMGRKITVDSATLMNKGLEAIEARWLFDVPPQKIKVLIHPEAIIHSIIEFVDGTINANMFMPDMKYPIYKALSYPDIIENDFPGVDFSSIKNFTFTEPDIAKFPAISLAFSALGQEGTAPAALNGANEAAVGLFLDGKIRFSDIIKKVDIVMRKHKNRDKPSLAEIIEAEECAKEEVLGSC